MKTNLYILFILFVTLVFPLELHAQTSYPYICYYQSGSQMVGLITYPSISTKAIWIKNDSVIAYNKQTGPGGMGCYIEIKYTKQNNEIITDSIIIDGCETPDIINTKFIYSQDSIINTTTTEVYYSNRYLTKVYRKARWRNFWRGCR